MSAAITDKFREATNGTRPDPTTLTAQKSVAAASISCGALTGWPTATAVDFIIYQKTASGEKVPGTQTDWIGIVSGSSINSLTLKAGTDQVYPIGSVVEAAPTAAWGDDMAQGIVVEHNQDGTHKTNFLTASMLSTTLQQGWQAGSGTWTFLSATTFSVPAADAADISIGTKIWFTQTTSKYFKVVDKSGTTITVTGAGVHTVANAAITAPFFSNAATPVGYPQSFTPCPLFEVFRNAAQTLTAGVATRINFDTEVYDTLNGYDNTTNFRWTATANSVVDVSAAFSSLGVGGGTRVIVSIYKNGTEVARGFDVTQAAANAVAGSVSKTIRVASGEYLEVFVLGIGGAYPVFVGQAFTYMTARLVDIY